MQHHATLPTVIGRSAPAAILLASMVSPLEAQSLEAPPASSTTTNLAMTPAAAMIEADRLRAWHDLLAFEPQIAGTEADHRSIERIDAAFEAMGLESDPWWFRPLLCYPVSARLEIVGEEPAPTRPVTAPGGRRGVVPLSVGEPDLLADPSTAHPDLLWGWNAFGGSGEAEAEIVYANYGLESDFARLKEWGVDVAGKIALVRYGGMFRGYKVRNAEHHGAVGVIIYTDPADSGETRGSVWPQGGGWANDACIQRGSVLVLAQPGDPLTPFEPALADAKRLEVDDAGLFTIPVQPIGYAAAREIMRRMNGREVASLPDGKPWVGGLELPYRVEGGEDLRIRLAVEQDRRLADTANVIAVIEGSEHPEELVVIGCHHDAWGFGACDPHAGSIALMEVARGFGELARRGVRPRRTLVFAAWGAEEYGIIGSTEWVEGERDRLARNGVAYLNLDMASMGPNFSMAASPSLRAAAKQAAAMTPAARDLEGHSVLDKATEGDRGFAPGSSGGGSDHVAFVSHIAMPVASIHGGGSAGTAYHSNYDTVTWYRAIVGEDYEPALMVARYTANLATLLAFEPLLPLRTEAVARDAADKLRAIAAPPALESLGPPTAALALRLEVLADRAAVLDATLDAIAAAPDSVPAATLAALNENLLRIDRAWWDERGLFDRPWFRNLSIATDRSNGYGSTAMPILAEPVADGDLERGLEGLTRLEAAVDRLEAVLATLELALATPASEVP